MLRQIALAAAMAACTVTPAYAQDELSEIVVTATRYVEAYERFSIPHISNVRRADFAVANITISSDTRDSTQRIAELRQALQSLTRYADRNAALSVALVEEDEDESGQARVVAFTVEKAMISLRAGSRVDTSQVTLAVRARISAADNLDSVEGRLGQFVQSIPRPGRVEASMDEIQLTLTNPQQYRPQLIAAIAADATSVSNALGPGYGAQLNGLESPIAWRRAGDLDLRLFIPYGMLILPRA
ncbi:MAG: hypothetical protein JNL81_14270 [Hyphomonadaceae bacterium]|nr:hypothetical protein [Hyphomonadaceae bacterium]